MVKSISASKNFRVYQVIKNKKLRTAKGVWYDNNTKKTFTDNIKFLPCENYRTAKAIAKKILKNTSEVCIAFENIISKNLFLLYRTKIDFYGAYKKIVIKDKKSFSLFKKSNKNYTLENTKNGIIVFNYYK